MKGLDRSLHQSKFQIYFKSVLDKETALCKDKQKEKNHPSFETIPQLKKEGKADNLKIIHASFFETYLLQKKLF